MLSYIKYTSTLDYAGLSNSAGSTALANIIYNMDTFNVDISNLRTIDNAGSEGATADGLMYGSNHIYLGATQSVPYPIPYTLGSELSNGVVTGSTNIIVTDLGGGSYRAVGTTVGSADRVNFNCVLATSEYVLLTFNASITSGTCTFRIYYDGAVVDMPDYQVVNGGNTIIVENYVAGSQIWLYPIVGQSFDITFSSVSSKQITNPNSFLTYFDVTTKQHVTVDNSASTPSTTKTIDTPTHHSNVFTTTAEVTAGDLTALNANPEDIARMVKGVATVGTYSFTLADIEAFYPGNEGEAGGANIYDVTDGTWATFSAIVNYTATCRTTYKNTNYGASNFLYTQDATGRPTGIHTDGHIKGGTDGRNITIAMTTPYNHVVTKDIDKIEGSLTSCTITYSDTTTLVVP